MIRLFAFVFVLCGLVAAPVTFDGANEAQAQKAKKVNKAKKVSVQGKTTFRGTKKGTTAGKTKITAAKKANGGKAVGETKLLFVKRGIRNTNQIMGDSRNAVKAGAKGADLLRNAVIRQHAARKAYAAGKPRQAFYLTRAARSLARDAIALNGIKVEIPKDEEAYVPTPEDMDGVDVFIKAVEDENLVPAIELLPNDETIGVDLPEDLGDDDGVVADPGSESEVEVE